MSGFSSLLATVRQKLKIGTKQEGSVHFAHVTCSGEGLSKKEIPVITDIDPLEHSYQLKQASGFVIIDMTRHPETGEVVYVLKHLPSSKNFRFTKTVFEFFFFKTVSLS